MKSNSTGNCWLCYFLVFLQRLCEPLKRNFPMKRLLTIAFSLLISMAVVAQVAHHAKWQSRVSMTDDSQGVITFTATIDNGWHVYSNELPAGGPTPLSVEWDDTKGVKLTGELKSSPAPTRVHDDVFDMDLSWWEKSVTLSQKFEVTGEKYSISGNLRYMTCNDRECNAPSTEPFSFSGTVQKKKSESESDVVQEESRNDEDSTLAASAPVTVSHDKLWAPVTYSDGNSPTGSSTDGNSLWYVFFACFLGGLLALLTPCVWPIIPLTVSFFLKKSENRRRAVASAITYGVAIIVIYLLLGLLVTAIFGADALNNLATNAVCNIVFFLLLVVFALSFFGAFEIKLPSSWSNRMDERAERTTGIVSIFFMAFTLVIVSFSCTGPIIGTLLVEAASSGSTLAPAVGMFAFALALALPFTLFALFPSWLKQLPRSGGWMNTVKVVLGFVELALSLKFLSVADLAYGWHILDREVFIVLWIVIFGALGMYLLGLIRFKNDDEVKELGVIRLFLALASLAFTAYLLPGLWGAPLRATSAFVPPMTTQDFNLNGEAAVVFDDFDSGMAEAAKTGKPVFIDFSGYGCVNCRKMEGAVMSRDDVSSLIHDRFITITLMVDDRSRLDSPIYVEENGKQVKLSTVGDKWSYLQRYKFNSNSQPFYVVLNPEGELISGPVAYDENVEKFMSFLLKALDK